MRLSRISQIFLRNLWNKRDDIYRQINKALRRNDPSYQIVHLFFEVFVEIFPRRYLEENKVELDEELQS